jgi:hypothetical protein
MATGYGSVYWLFALECKYPRAGRLRIGNYVFPSNQLSRELRLETIHRHHASESRLQQAMSQAGRAAELTKRVGCFPFWGEKRHKYKLSCESAKLALRVCRIRRKSCLESLWIIDFTPCTA